MIRLGGRLANGLSGHFGGTISDGRQRRGVAWIELRGLGGEVVQQRAVGRLDHGGVRRRACRGGEADTIGLVSGIDGDRGVVDGGRDVAHIHEAFALEGAGTDYRILSNLVPLGDFVGCDGGDATPWRSREHDDTCGGKALATLS